MTDEQIKRMVERFLAWKLPEDFNPDGGIDFERFGGVFGRPHSQFRREPTGTNLFTYEQAKAMVQHMLEGVESDADRMRAALRKIAALDELSVEDYGKDKQWSFQKIAREALPEGADFKYCDGCDGYNCDADKGCAYPSRNNESALLTEIHAELSRARTKFPGKNVTFAALVEEVGELATAIFEESRERVRKEAVQVAVMAMRVVLDGDHCFDQWRASKNLDPLTRPDGSATL